MSGSVSNAMPEGAAGWASADANVAGLSFEDALAELERIVRGLEGGQQRLEDAITAYERGSALRRHCETKLREAEMRVEKIVAGAGDRPIQITALDAQASA